MGGEVAQLVERRTGTPLRQVRIPGGARDFFLPVNFQCRPSYGVHTPPCAAACINTCARIKDHVVHVRVRWIMETLKHYACTVGWVVRLSRSWLSLKESNPNFPWKKSQKDNTVIKNVYINIENKAGIQIFFFSHFPPFSPNCVFACVLFNFLALQFFVFGKN